MNQPPQVSRPSDIGAPVPLQVFSGQETVVVTIVANDPDGEILTFVWDIPRATEPPDAQDFQSPAGDWVSVARIPASWLADGDALEVTISDQAEPRHVVTVQWTVQVSS